MTPRSRDVDADAAASMLTTGARPPATAKLVKRRSIPPLGPGIKIEVGWRNNVFGGRLNPS